MRDGGPGTGGRRERSLQSRLVFTSIPAGRSLFRSCFTQ